LTPKSIILDDLELLQSDFRRISREFADWEATTGKRMKIDPETRIVSDGVVTHIMYYTF